MAKVEPWHVATSTAVIESKTELFIDFVQSPSGSWKVHKSNGQKTLIIGDKSISTILRFTQLFFSW